jgi:hypothetical protein
MKSTEMLKEIKNLLGIELSDEANKVEVSTEEVKVELAQMTLENGTVLEAEEFASGNEVFIVTEEDRIALPVGEYEMEDGKVLVIVEEGIIGEIKSEEDAEEAEQPADEEVEAEQELAEEEMAYVSKEEFAAAIGEIKSLIEEVKAGYDKKEEMAEVEEQVKQELSETPAAEPIKHNPETENKKEVFNYSPNKSLSTRDRVFAKLFNQ